MFLLIKGPGYGIVGMGFNLFQNIQNVYLPLIRGVTKMVYTRTICNFVFVGPHICLKRTTDSFIKDHLWSW